MNEAVTPAVSLHRKTVLLAGGSGLLGRALIRGLSGAGAKLVVASRTADSLRPFLQEAGLADAPVSLVPLDLGDPDSIDRLLPEIIEKWGSIDGMVFNAVSRPMRSMDDDLAAWEASMKVNATGFFALSRAVARVMTQRGGGSVVNIGSIQGMLGSQPWLYEGTDMGTIPDYFFHKGGMLNLTRYLASEYGKSKVRFNTVSPGGIANPDRPQPPEFVRRYSALTMLGRLAEADEVCGAVAFLLSDAASYITGVNLPVDAGYSAK